MSRAQESHTDRFATASATKIGKLPTFSTSFIEMISKVPAIGFLAWDFTTTHPLSQQDMQNLSDKLASIVSTLEYIRSSPTSTPIQLITTLLQAGMANYAMRKYGEAVSYLLEGRQNCEKILDTKLPLSEDSIIPYYIVTLFTLGSTYDTLGRPNAALATIQLAIQIQENASLYRSTHNHTTSLYKLATIYKSTDEAAVSLKLLSQALDMEIALVGEQSTIQKAIIYGERLSVHRLQGDSEHALECAEQFLEIYIKISTTINIPYCCCTTLNEVGDIYRAMGKEKSAIGAYKRALNIENNFMPHTSTAIKTILTTKIAKIEHNIGELEEAVKYYIKSLSGAESLNPGISTEQKVELLHNLGEIYHTRGDLQRAITYYNDSLKMVEKLSTADCSISVKYLSFRITTHQNLGYIYESMPDKSDSKALSHHLQALALLEANPHSQGVEMIETLHKKILTLQLATLSMSNIDEELASIPLRESPTSLDSETSISSLAVENPYTRHASLIEDEIDIDERKPTGENSSPDEVFGE